MQKLTVEELKRLLYDTFCDHLSMKDIENIIMTEEEGHIENPDECPVDIDSNFMCFFKTFCLSPLDLSIDIHITFAVWQKCAHHCQDV